jgi:hypothetical protein
VVGIVTSKADAIALATITQDIPQNINFAIKSRAALTFLQSADVKPTISTAGSAKTPSDIAVLAKSMSVMVNCEPSKSVTQRPTEKAVVSSEKPAPQPIPPPEAPAPDNKLDYSNCAVVLEAVKTCEHLKDCSAQSIEKNFSARERQHFQSISGKAAFTTEKPYAQCTQTCQRHAYKTHPTREELCGY